MSVSDTRESVAGAINLCKLGGFVKFGTKHIVAAFSLNLDGNTELSVKKWEIREPYHSSSGYGEIVKSVGFDTDPDGYQILEHPTGTYNVKDLRPHGTGKQFVLTRTQ